MSPEDQQLWEAEEMNLPIDLKACNLKIDPSPFQLVEKTSLLKVHSLFSMIGINHAYVTKIGRLVGVVALKEVQKSVQFLPTFRQSCPYSDSSLKLLHVSLHFPATESYRRCE